MKRFLFVIAGFLLVSAVAFAHGNYEHVRGVVTQLSATSITVQTTGTTTKTLTITDKTKFEQSGAPATREALKVGDRVVIDVPKGKAEAAIITFGAPKKSTDHHDHS